MAEIIDLDQVRAGIISSGGSTSLADAPCAGTDYVCAGNDQPCGIDWACKSGNDAECSQEDHACNGEIVSEAPAQPAQQFQGF